MTHLWTLTIIVATLAAGCLGGPAGVPPKEQHDGFVLQGGVLSSGLPLPPGFNLTIPDNSGLTIRLNGFGWGQIRMESPAKVTVNVKHDTLNFSSRPNFPGESPYPPGLFTVVRTDVWPDPHESDAQHFAWYGRESAVLTTDGSSLEARAGSLIATSGLALLTVATNVPGYSLELNGGGTERLWNLTAHEDLQAWRPEPVDIHGQALEVARVSHRREWRASVTPQGPSALHAWAWIDDRQDVAGVNAGVADRGLRILAPNEPAPAPDLQPAFGFGNRFSGHPTVTTVITDPVDAVYWSESTDAGTTTRQEGMMVLQIPLDWPAR